MAAESIAHEAGYWRNSLFGFELHNSPALDSYQKRRKERVVFQKTVIEPTFDYGIEAKYEYWIVHFMNGLLNQQTKSFFR